MSVESRKSRTSFSSITWGLFARCLVRVPWHKVAEERGRYYTWAVTLCDNFSMLRLHTDWLLVPSLFDKRDITVENTILHEGVIRNHLTHCCQLRRCHWIKIVTTYIENDLVCLHKEEIWITKILYLHVFLIREIQCQKLGMFANAPNLQTWKECL